MVGDSEYDGIILGSGHNSLVLQAYLCRAGLEVVCVERRDTPGGGLTTVEDARHPGFLHNTHSFFHRALNRMPWYLDLDLERHGAVYVEPELNVALILKDDDVLEWWTDFDRTASSFDRFSARDGATLRSWRDRFAPIVDQILIPESQAPPLPPDARSGLLGKTAEGRLLLETSRLSPLDFVLREFEHPVIQAGLLFFNGLREVDLRCPGFGHHIAALLASDGKAQMSIGGAASLARALVSSVQENGGEVRVQTPPRRILVENGRAVGIETEGGERIGARHFVASGLNPHQTFLDLIDAEHLPREWGDKAAGFRYNLIAPLFGLNLNLDEPPAYKASARHPEVARAFMTIIGLEHVDFYHRIVSDHEAGRIPPPVMWGCCPTLFDPTQAPEGKHTAFMWKKLPYRLGGDPAAWDKAREPHGLEMLDFWREYAPNLDQAVIDWFARSPLDAERTFPNMREGDLLIGAFTHGQIGYDRPFPGAGHYRAHLDGLFLCGSCCHPGGNITGLPGYNAAQVILSDLGISADWVPGSIQDQLERLG